MEKVPEEQQQRLSKALFRVPVATLPRCQQSVGSGMNPGRKYRQPRRSLFSRSDGFRQLSGRFRDWPLEATRHPMGES